MIHTSVNGLSEKLYDLESAVGTTITDLGTGLSNGIAAATGFSSSQQQSTHLRRTLNNAVNQNSESLSSLKSLKENFSATLASNQETYSSLVRNCVMCPNVPSQIFICVNFHPVFLPQLIN